MDRAVLRGADFTGTQLQRANLIGVISQEARFDRADLSGARLSGANALAISANSISALARRAFSKLAETKNHLAYRGPRVRILQR